jgi:hypothetical protein
VSGSGTGIAPDSSQLLRPRPAPLAAVSDEPAVKVVGYPHGLRPKLSQRQVDPETVERHVAVARAAAAAPAQSIPPARCSPRPRIASAGSLAPAGRRISRPRTASFRFRRAEAWSPPSGTSGRPGPRMTGSEGSMRPGTNGAAARRRRGPSRTDQRTAWAKAATGWSSVHQSTSSAGAARRRGHSKRRSVPRMAKPWGMSRSPARRPKWP